MKKAPMLFFTLFVLLFNGCTPQPVLKMQPVSSDITWYNGKAYVLTVQDSLELEASFAGYRGSLMRFNVAITNLSSEEQLVDPGRFFYRAIREVNGRPSTRSYASIDPEDKIAELEKNKKSIQRNGKFEDGLYAFILLASAVAYTADLVSGNNTNSVDCEDEEGELIPPDHEEREDRINAIIEQQEHWRLDTIRKTTLATNESIEGQVYYPANKTAGIVQLVFRIADKNIEVDFKQVRQQVVSRY